MTSYSTLTETVHLSCTVLEIKQVICRKSLILTHPISAFGDLVGGEVKFRGDLGHHKTGVPGLSCGVISIIPRSAILV